MKCHIEFLERQGIAGVSHHSLLFSKTANVPLGPENNEVQRSFPIFLSHQYDCLKCYILLFISYESSENCLGSDWCLLLEKLEKLVEHEHELLPFARLLLFILP